MTTEVSICNLALAHLGQDAITALSDSTKRAIFCNQFYSVLRDQLLSSYVWSFATKRVALVEDATATATLVALGYQWTEAFTLPTGYLRMLEIEEEDEEDWEIETVGTSTVLVTNTSAATAKYIAQITDVAKFTNNFVMALSYMIAEKLAYPLIKSVEVAEKMRALAKAELADVRTLAAQEGTLPFDLGASQWLDARRSNPVDRSSRG